MGGSPTPSRSPSPSVEAEADDKAVMLVEVEAVADILAEAEAMADILAKAKFKSDGSPDYVTTDLEGDHLHGYVMPILLGLNLFLHVSPYHGLVCPVCPNRKAYGWSDADARVHVLATAPTPTIKNVARHHALARKPG